MGHPKQTSAPESSKRGSRAFSVWKLAVAAAASIVLLYRIQGWAHQQLRGYTVCSESGSIYTADESKPTVECMFVKGSIIVETGPFIDIENHRLLSKPGYVPSALLKILHRRNVHRIGNGSIIVPGLTDAHAHIMEYGLMKQLPLAATDSIDDIVAHIKEYILSHPDIRDDPTQWIQGFGWDQTNWPGSQFPTASDLDRDPLLRNRPISLARVDGHARWVSHRVLELMGDLPDEVEGGHIIRDSNGKPTGIFVDNAQDLIPSPPLTEERLSDFLDLTMKDALSHGLTTIHDAETRLNHLSVFKKKAETGDLPIRVYAMGHVPSHEYWGGQLPRLRDYGKHKRLTLRSVKLYADGALGSWGAALIEPYSDKPNTRGLLLTPPEVLSNLTLQFWKDGFQVNVHCIGDRANREILDIYERVLRQGADSSTWRPRIEHAQIFSLEDLDRIGRLGGPSQACNRHMRKSDSASPEVERAFQIALSRTSDMHYAELRLGTKRIKGAYAYQTLLKASPHNVLPLGSDFPVESVNPLLGFYAAVSRLDPKGFSPHGPGGWYPEERLTRTQALKGMTLDAAYASFTEDSLGSLTPGKMADFVVLDRDIMTIPLAEILETRVTATVIDGRVMYGGI